MSKEKNTQQMSLWEGSHVNPSASQENKKVQTMTAISGQKCLDSLGRSNPNSLLGRMCKELLTSKTAWYSDRCKTNWKVKVSKSNVSLFQLQASVLGTKGTESGLWATPNTMDYLPPRSAAGTKKIMEGHRKGRTKPSNLREQVDPETMKMYPTPNAKEPRDLKKIDHYLKTGEMRYSPTGYKHPRRLMLEETVIAEEKQKKMYPTPTQDSASERTKKYKQGGKPLTVAVREEVKMYPTPTVVCEEGGEQSHLVERTKSGGFVSRRKGSGIETIGRNALSREDVSNSNGERLQGRGISTDLETEQRSIDAKNSIEEQQTWWQIESDLCGVPNGISYELDKDRANRIKTLGNAIVPQIAREFGLAIKKVLSDEDII